MQAHELRELLDSRAKQLVAVALLGTADFDPCDPLTGIDDASVVARAASPATNRACCRDENGDGFVDMVVYFRARDLEDPSETECADPDALLELTAATLDGRSYRGSDRVGRLRCD